MKNERGELVRFVRKFVSFIDDWFHPMILNNGLTTNRSLASLCFDLSGCHSLPKARYLFVISFESGDP